MKKKFSLLFAALLSALLLCTSVLPAYATPAINSESNVATVNVATGISPRLTNCVTASFSFGVTQAGDATFYVSYEGYDTFTYAKLTVEVQKKFLGLFWTDVDEWTGYCYDKSGMFYDSVPADGTGTYRALFTLEVYGTTGVVDVIEDEIDCKYS